MMNAEVITTNNSFLTLREKYDSETTRRIFRTQMVGGLNEDDVTKFILQLREDSKNLEQELRSEIEKLLTCKNDLEQVSSENEKLKRISNKAQTDLDFYVSECRKMDKILQSSTDKRDSEIDQLQDEICQMKKNKDELEKALSESCKEIDRITEQSAMFEEENNLLKSKIIDLEEETSCKNLQYEDMKKVSQNFEQQIEFEKSNTEKQNRDLEVLRQENITIKETLANKMDDLENQRMRLEELERIAENADRLEEENTLMKSKIADMEQEASSNIAQYDDMKRTYHDLEQQIEFEKLLNEEQSKDLEMLQQKNTALEETIAKKTFELEEQRKINEESSNELKLEKARATNNEIVRFKDEVIGIYKKIETIADEQSKMNIELQYKLDEQSKMNSELQYQLDELSKMNKELQYQLDEQVKNNSMLQQQLAIQQMEAIKSEEKQAELVRCISGLKQNLCSEQALLDTQLNQISERRNEINGCLMILQEIL